MIDKDKLWIKLMIIGLKSGCHQIPERSFFVRGYQFPVCARCTGVLAGYISCLIISAFIRPNIVTACLCCLVMLIDWLLQHFKIKASTNPRRLVTGIIGGFGLMSVYIWVISRVLDFFF